MVQIKEEGRASEDRQTMSQKGEEGTLLLALCSEVMQ